ncbi:MAG: mandelate racemase/muconate lactonizing enzyme family protein [Candidatus Dormibacteria bacterium]
MKITRISSATVEANFDWTIVRVETDERITGHGEAFLQSGLPAQVRVFDRLLVGSDPLNVGPLWTRMCWAASAEQARHAISGIETALLDIKGQALGVPIWQLLGGRYREKVRIYLDCHAGQSLESIGPLLLRRRPEWAGGGEASGSYFDPSTEDAADFTPEAYAAAARAAVGRGYTALKFDLDVPTPGVAADPHARVLAPAQLDHLLSLVEAVIAAVPRTVEVAFDCHWRFTLRDATRLSQAVQHLPLAWLEDPTPPHDIEALRAMRRASSTSIGMGENWYGLEAFQEPISAEVIDVVLPDLQKCGGLREGQRIAELAGLHNLLVSPHNISGPIGTLASAHLCAAIPNFLALEFHAADVPFFDSLLAGREGPLVRDGHVEVGDAPGLGAVPNMEVLARYAKAGEPIFD